MNQGLRVNPDSSVWLNLFNGDYMVFFWHMMQSVMIAGHQPSIALCSSVIKFPTRALNIMSMDVYVPAFLLEGQAKGDFSHSRKLTELSLGEALIANGIEELQMMFLVSFDYRSTGGHPTVLGAIAWPGKQDTSQHLPLALLVNSRAQQFPESNFSWTMPAPPLEKHESEVEPWVNDWRRLPAYDGMGHKEFSAVIHRKIMNWSLEAEVLNGGQGWLVPRVQGRDSLSGAYLVKEGREEYARLLSKDGACRFRGQPDVVALVMDLFPIFGSRRVAGSAGDFNVRTFIERSTVPRDPTWPSGPGLLWSKTV